MKKKEIKADYKKHKKLMNKFKKQLDKLEEEKNYMGFKLKNNKII